MGFREEFLKAVQEGEQALPRRRQWVPGVEWTGREGTITTDAIAGEPAWREILTKWELDPNEYEIVEPVLFNSWGGPDGLLNRQYKARVVRRSSSPVDYEDLLRRAARVKPSKPTFQGEAALNVVLADWQIGKSDGDGVEGTVARIMAAKTAIVHRAMALRKMGYDLGRLNVLWTGDSVEGCLGFYSNQAFLVELDRRDQMKLTRRLLTDSLQTWAKSFREIMVVAVAGNHGEHRANGRMVTGPQDNDDLAVVEQVAEILAANEPAFGHVRFALAKDAVTATIPVCGWILGISHGHIAKSSGGVEQRLRGWWEKQAAGRQRIGDADILVTGHYHHLRVADWGSCLWLQAPALDGGSEYWRARTGEASAPGMLTFVTTERERATEIAVLTHG